MLDLIYVALTALIFLLASLVAKGVERRAPAADSPPDAKQRAERSRG